MAKISSVLIGCFVAVPALVLGASMTASLQEPPAKTQQDIQARPLIASVEGKDLFQAYCASCHGREATGQGPAAPALKSPVPDLTTIARRNAGVFPKARIRKIISGDDAVISHGSREMPVWGPIFHQVERDRDWGSVRLENLATYLESIQKK